MYKDFWDAAKDFGRTMLEYADYEYYKQLHDYYNDALENNGQFNLDDCRWPKFILRRRVDNLEAELKKRNESLVEGSCKKALEEVNKIIETLKPNDKFPLVGKIQNFDVICRNFVYRRTTTKLDRGRNIPCNISPKDVKKIHNSNVATINAFIREVSRKGDDEYPVNLVELVKNLRE